MTNPLVDGNFLYDETLASILPEKKVLFRGEKFFELCFINQTAA
jgi:hypothetical protein